MKRFIRERSLLVVVILLVLATGCGAPAVEPTAIPPTPVPPTATPVPPTPTPVPPTETPAPPTNTPASGSSGLLPPSEEGWEVYEMADNGYAISLPEEWEKIDLDPQTISATVAVLKEGNPELAELVEGYAGSVFQSGGSFFAFDLGSNSLSSGMMANVNVLQQDLGADLSIDFIIQLSAGQIENLANVVPPVESDVVEVPAGEAGVLRYKMTLNQVGGISVTMSAVQYVFIKDQVMYILTMGAPTEQEAAYLPLFDKIAQTFRFTQ